MVLLTTPKAPAAIAQYLEQRGTKQSWLAGQIGMHPSSFSRMLTGGSRGPAERLTPDLIRRIAHALDVPRAVEADWLGMLEGTAE
jgi:antitoxin component HigA of HigAB toxin-antitoxin module